MFGVSRRSLLKAAIGTAAIAPLASCGGGQAGSDGRVRVAFSTSGAQESLDPHTSSLFVDQARAKALFDTLIAYSDEMAPVPRLAESWDTDATGSRWRIRLRGARFHDNSPVTAADVLYSYRRIADPATGSPAADQFSNIDFAASREISEREIELVLHAPNFEFPLTWGAPATEIVPAGTRNFNAPVGSGPFRFGTFQPGQNAVFHRFDGHWNGAPTPPELEFVSINEESARVSALVSGQVHYADDVSTNSTRMLDGDERTNVLAAPNGTMQAVALKVDRPPFDDPRLVRAIQSGVDRQALLDVALSGSGQLGNDLFGSGLKYYPSEIPQRSRDVDRARSLVREANAEGLRFELHTSAADPYFEPAATLISEQLKEIGLRATPRVGPAESYFSDIAERGGAAHTRTAALPIPTFIEQRMIGNATSDNYTEYDSAEFDALFARALRTRDEARRAELFADAQRIARDESGLVVWGFSDWNVGVSSELRGVAPAPPNSLRWARFDNATPG